MDNQKTFDSLFEGMDLTPEFKEQLRTVFEDAVQKKLDEKEATSIAQQQAAGAALSAKNTGDTSSLKGASKAMYKGMSKKELEKMASVKHKGLPNKIGEEDEIVTLESEMENDEPTDFKGTKDCVSDCWDNEKHSPLCQHYEGLDEDTEEENPTEPDEDLTPEEIRKLIGDIDFKRVLAANDEEIGKFYSSMTAGLRDLTGNTLADPFRKFITKLLDIIANDTIISTKIAQDIKGEEVEVFESIVESVDKYLTYVAESWVEENKLAIEEGLKFEIFESFFNGAKNLLSEHNIAVPEGKDPIAEANNKISELESQIQEQKESFEKQLNEEITKTISYKNRAEKEVKNNIFESVSKDLTVVQKERFKKLVESVSFDSKSSYEQTLRDIAKNAFEVSTKSSKKNLTEEALFEKTESDGTVSENPVMSLYADAISKNLKF